MGYNGPMQLSWFSIGVIVVSLISGSVVQHMYLNQNAGNKMALRDLLMLRDSHPSIPLCNAEHKYTLFPKLFEDPADAQAMVEYLQNSGSIRQYRQEDSSQTFGEDVAMPESGVCPLGLSENPSRTRCQLNQRFDLQKNFVLTGGYNNRREVLSNLISRISYFREAWAHAPKGVDNTTYAGKPDIVRKFIMHPGIIEAASKLYEDRPIVKPTIGYSNVYLGGQALGVHTDVPHFRGMFRNKIPQWFLTVMHHSGLFERWRLHIATAVSWYHNTPEGGGGEFVLWPKGPYGDAVVHKVAFNTMALLDTDTVQHGVATVKRADEGANEGAKADAKSELPHGAELVYVGNDTFALEFEGNRISTHHWADMRYSISWKAYCFRDEDEVRVWQEDSDLMDYDTAQRMLIADMQKAGLLPKIKDVGQDIDQLTGGMDRLELADLMVAHYIVFPRKSTLVQRLLSINTCFFLGEALPSIARLWCGE